MNAYPDYLYTTFRRQVKLPLPDGPQMHGISIPLITNPLSDYKSPFAPLYEINANQYLTRLATRLGCHGSRIEFVALICGKETSWQSLAAAGKSAARSAKPVAIAASDKRRMG
jgi:hypothetical protein